MDRNACAAPAEDDSSEPCGAAESHVRPLPETLPESEAQGQLSTVYDATEASGERAPLLSPGTCIAGKYILCDVLGIGGSAVVYAAEQVGLKRVVAFKVYPARGPQAAAMLRRFEREAHLLACVHHENVVAVFDAGRTADGAPYLVVQRLHGDTLATRLCAAAPLPVMEAVDIARQVLNALSALSEAGIIHRDVKPDNIVLDRLPEGGCVVKLVDFGIAKQAHEAAARELDEMVGTPGYMAPEQVRGENIDARCDLYALGATLYEMLTGRTPHAGDTVQQVAMATLFGTIPPLRTLRDDCPDGLAQIVMKALARDASDRFASAREMKSALDRWQAAQDTGMSPEPVHEREDIEDTLRISMPSAPRLSSRRMKKSGFAVVACLAALCAFSLSRAFPISFPTGEVPGPVAALATLASELVPRDDLTFQAQSRASALLARTSARAFGLWTEARTSPWLARTSASAAELWIQARTAAHELLEVARRAAPAWSDRSARE